MNTNEPFESNQRYIDLLVLAVGGTLLMALIAMLANSPALMLVIPLCVAVFLYLSVSGLPDPLRRRTIYAVIHSFNAVSVLIWIATLALLNEPEPLFWGLPPATAILVYIGWPFFTLVSGLMYAYVSKLAGLLREEDASPIGAERS